MPCSDAEAYHAHKEDTSTHVLQQDYNHTHSSDACSPFCSCQCCHIDVSQSQPLVVVTTLHKEPIKPYFSYLIPAEQEVVSPILQPPRI